MLGQSEGVMPGEVRLGKYVFQELQNLSKTGAIADVYPTRRIGEKDYSLVLRRAKFGQDSILADEINIRTTLSGDNYLRDHMPKMEQSGEASLRPYIIVERIPEEDLISVLDVAENLKLSEKQDVASQLLNITEHWHQNNWLINDIGNSNPLEGAINKADRYILMKKAGRLTVVDLDANLAKKIDPFKQMEFKGDEKKQLNEYRRNIYAIEFINSEKGRQEISAICDQVNKLRVQDGGQDIKKLKKDLKSLGDNMFANGISPEDVATNKQDLWFVNGLQGDSILQLNDISRLIHSLEQNNFTDTLTKIKRSGTKWNDFNPIFNEGEIVSYIQTKIYELKSELYTRYFPGRDRVFPQFGQVVWKHTMDEVNKLTQAAENEFKTIDDIPKEVLEKNNIRNNDILNEYQCVLTILEKLLGSEFETQIQELRVEVNNIPRTKDIHIKTASLIRGRLGLLN